MFNEMVNGFNRFSELRKTVKTVKALAVPLRVPLKRGVVKIHPTNWRETFVMVSFGLMALSPFAMGAEKAAPRDSFAIVCPAESSPAQSLATREVRRYLYLRTGSLLPIVRAGAELPKNPNLIVIGPRQWPVVETLAARGGFSSETLFLRGDEYLLKTFTHEGRTVWLATAGADTGVLYAAYRFAEFLGVRFYLEGDVVPDQRLSLVPLPVEWEPGGKPMGATAKAASVGLPRMNEHARPLFSLRGIQPFHDFPEGPDWWNLDDYLAIISQLPKLRMNFFGLHTYPEKHPNAEPTVWIGLPQDVAPDGQVTFSYPSSYMNTRRGNWGYAAKSITNFSHGAAMLFTGDAYGPDVMGQWLPEPKTPEACNEVFNRTAEMLRQAFTHARQLGVKTCVGTETPLTVPAKVQERLKALGKNPADLKTVGELYEGMFTRIARAHPLDYYWFWTPEGWTWQGAKPEQVTATTNDLMAAIQAAKKVGAPFGLATCGWVLGPQQDRALFDTFLPKDVAVSCINREVGKTPVDKGFARVQGRGKWAIPWLEDDPALTAPQLWASRMRRDARDALAYGCDGLMGIHWRTRSVGPMLGALAQAAWDQSWAKSSPAQAPVLREGPDGGKYAHFTSHAIADTTDAPIYQHVRYGMSAYRLHATNGLCSVTLKFCEPHYKEAGKRIFSVQIQGQEKIKSLDIFSRVGQNRALDLKFDGLPVSNGWLEVEFVAETESPCLAGLVVAGEGYTRKINCGGPAYQDYAADWPEGGETPKGTFPAVDDFYRDWAQNQFGPEIALPVSRILAKMDGRLPRPADWVHGPGGIKPDPRPWSQVQSNYVFVHELAGWREDVRGAGNLERFDYWLNTFRYLEAMARVNCTWALVTNAMGKAKAAPDPQAQRQIAAAEVLPLRQELVRQVSLLYDLLLATVTNPGELGTVANWEQHLFPDLLEKPGQQLAAFLGRPLPPDAELPRAYRGPARLIVPTKRASVAAGSDLTLRALVLAEKPPREVAVFWRKLGQGAFAKVPMKHEARGVYSLCLPAAKTSDDLEYYVRAVPDGEPALHFPATAPTLNWTVVRQ